MLTWDQGRGNLKLKMTRMDTYIVCSIWKNASGEGCGCITWWILSPLKILLTRASTVASFFNTYVCKYSPKPTMPSSGTPQMNRSATSSFYLLVALSVRCSFSIFSPVYTWKRWSACSLYRLRKRSNERTMTFIYAGISFGRFPFFLTGKWETWRIPYTYL